MHDSLNILRDVCHDISKTHGFWNGLEDIPKQYIFSTKIMLVVTELSEAIEAARVDNWQGKDGVAEELADAVIRIMDISGSLKIDIDKSVRDKIALNKTREQKHGKKF
jgi:NTP pyrophosphatase (non-canonical NTP hydrolase)